MSSRPLDPTPKKSRRIVDVLAVDGPVLTLTFDSGETRRVDIMRVFGAPTYARLFLSDAAVAAVSVDPRGDLIWSNGYGLSCATLYAVSEAIK